MKKAVPTLAVLSVLIACQADSPAEPVVQEPQLTVAADGLSSLEQSILDAAMAGAIIDRDVGCGQTSGFFNNGVFVGFGGLFPTAGPQGICPLSNFVRTNRDGSVDLHMQGSGQFFLFLFNPFAIFPSAGSDVIWRQIQHENGIRVFTVTGTLSDGSRVRAQFVTDPNGDNKAANTLWVEGLGYVVGGPPGL